MDCGTLPQSSSNTATNQAFQFPKYINNVIGRAQRGHIELVSHVVDGRSEILLGVNEGAVEIENENRLHAV